MVPDPLLLKAGLWLAVAAIACTVLTLAGFRARWGVRFRLVGVTSFTALLAVACLAFSISYEPHQNIPGAARVPIVFDNGSGLIVAAAPSSLPQESVAPTLKQLALNQTRRQLGSGKAIRVRLRRLEPAQQPGSSRPRILGEAVLPLGEPISSIRLKLAEGTRLD